MAGSDGIWGWAKTETDLVSLYEWLDSQSNHGGTKRDWILTSVILVCYGIALFASLGFYKGNHIKVHDSPGVFLWSMGGATLATMLAIAWYYWTGSKEVREHRRQIGAAQSFIWKLYSARWRGSIKGLIGEEAALSLNAAAYDVLRCRLALKSPAWQGLSADSPYLTIRDKAGMTMEAAMARLLTRIGQGGSPKFPEIQQLQSDINLMAEEIIKSSEKLALSKGISGDVSNDLRQVLTEMRALNAAQDEVMNLERLL
jgi:hypothetical protein